ncbi:methyl-accepting chemotaxis protein [Halopseudomonas laoshanensis]|uniref:Methyl-accepting chemotaxis protein n=1 Tax=Halopseudomonas laoshanensis TaxID=2268758 RepID=A0A7V7GW96_9GAMM|nr:methyl-accepting chemotaxis protein [Halopseudomonas laoshanensis]KAA0696558.1 methyl-accepting chemotaxis protein [Halopseudomonas laoshanensis]
MSLFNFSRKDRNGAEQLDRLFDHLDLSVTVPEQAGLLGRIGRWTGKLQQRITLSLHAAVGIAAHAPKLASIARATETQGDQLAESSEMIASAIEEISASLESELVPGATAVANLASSVSTQLQACETDSQLVLGQVDTIQATEQSLATEIQTLSKQLEEVNQVIAMIANISQQTNLLALNAAIEAARAGEQGRGFAVVADEVRRLAGHTTQATDQVGQIINGLRSGMQRLHQAGDSMHQAISDGREGILRVDQGLSHATESMAQLDQRVAGMASGTEQIGAAVRSVSADVQKVADVAGELKQSATQVRKHSDAVRLESDRLLEGLGEFQLGVHQQIRERVVALAREPAICSNMAAAEKLMRNCLAQDGRFELMYLVGADGLQVSENLLAPDLECSGAKSMKGSNWSSRSWFRKVKDQLTPQISPVYRSSATDAFCFTLSAPVFSGDGQLRYVIGADVRLSALLEHGGPSGRPQLTAIAS